MVPCIAISNNSNKYQSFVLTQVNDQKCLFLTIQFSISHLFALNLNVKLLYLIRKKDPIWYYQSGPVWTWEQWQ